MARLARSAAYLGLQDAKVSPGQAMAVRWPGRFFLGKNGGLYLGKLMGNIWKLW